MLYNWRHNSNYICAGSMRIAKVDIDTNPSVKYINELLDWVCKTFNASINHEAAIKQAVSAERDACALLCEQLIGIGHQSVNDAYKTSASAIRQRGEK